MQQGVPSGETRDHSSDRLETLAEISRVLSATLDLGTLYETIYQQVGRVMDTTRFFIALHRPHAGTIEIAYHRLDGELTTRQVVPRGKSVTSHVIEHGTSLLFRGDADYVHFAEANGLPSVTLGDEGSESMIFVPLRTENVTIGAMSVQTLGEDVYTDDDVRTLLVLASQAAIAIENARLFAQQESRVTELQTIQRLVEKLISVHDIPAIAATIEQELKALIDYHACRLFVVQPGSGELVAIDQNRTCLHLAVGEGLAGWVAQHGRAVYIPDTLNDSRMKQIEGTPVRPESMLAAPLVYEGQVRGVIALSRLGAGEFDENALRLLEIVAAQAAIVFDRARLYDELKVEAVTDELTQLNNRRYLMERYAGERSRALRSGHTLSAIMLDIDRFKRINDTHGHDAGNLVLQHVAAAIRSVVRVEDVVARIGGEEFCVLIPKTDTPGVENAARRLREVIAACPLPLEAGVASVTVSVGVAHLQNDDRSTELFTRADQALYQAKRHGGNLTCVTYDDTYHVYRDERLDHVLSAASATTVESAAQQLDFVVSSVWLAGVTLDLEWRVTSANPCFLQLTGYDAHEIIGRTWAETFLPAGGGATTATVFDTLLSVRRSGPYEDTLLTRRGEERIMAWSAVVLHDSRNMPSGVLCLGDDITERRTAEAKIKQHALYDDLTGLTNRTLFHDRLHQAILAAQRDAHSLTILLLDIDRFKEINETLGHWFGDLLLQEVAQRLRGSLRESDTIARLGGDGFAVLLPATDEVRAIPMAEKIIHSLEQPFDLQGHTLEGRASIGGVVYPLHGGDGDELLRRADIAMYAAKRSHAGFCIYAAEMDENSPARLRLSAQLRQAIGQDQLLLHYQPKVACATGEIEGVEALVRWHHPDRGLLHPDEFIPLAEQTGLIMPLGLWVLNAGLLQCRLWDRVGKNRLHVAINLSAQHLHDPALVTSIEQLLSVWEVDAARLSIEITESAVMADPVTALDILIKLSDMGVRISIDDFGTGYSSLAYLKRLPADELKIDRSFVTDMCRNPEDAVIVRSVIDLGHNLGLRVVAEGVEDRETWDRLRALGCDLAQGYYFSRPVPADDLADWLGQNEDTRRERVTDAR